MAVQDRPLGDRLATRQVANALTSPGSILLLGAGAAAGILLGGIGLGVAVGLGAYAARVGLAIPRRKRSEQVDLKRLRPPWRDYVAETLDAKARYDTVVHSLDEGPLRERLGEIGLRIADGVREAWRIAQRGQALQSGLGSLNVNEVRQQLAAAQHEAVQAGGGNPSTRRRIEALTAQLQTAERLSVVIGDAADRLRLLDARLDEAVARAVELSLAPEEGLLSGLGSDVDNLVGEMEALRQALDETGGGAPQMGVA